MLRNLIAVSLIFGSVGLAGAQDKKEPARKAEGAVQIFETMTGTSYLGIQMQEVSRENFAKFGLSDVRGVAIEKVVENSPAAQAGLQAGDVIVRVEGEEVTSTRKLSRLISEVAPDHQAKMTVLRGGSERDVTVTMGKNPQFRAATLDGMYGLPGIPEFPDLGKLRQTIPIAPNAPVAPGEPFKGIFLTGESRQIGVGTVPMTKQLGEYFGIGEGKGLLINDVRADSPAAKAGLKAGDIIVEADGKEIKSSFDLVRAVTAQKEGDVTLTIVRNRERQTVRVTPEKGKGNGFVYEFKDEEGRKFFNTPLAPLAPAKALTVTAPKAFTEFKRIL